MWCHAFNPSPIILGGQSTPFGCPSGQYRNVSAPLLAALAIEGTLQTTNTPPSAIAGVWMGCALAAGLGQAPARQAALMAGLPSSVPCALVNKVCGSGLMAVLSAAHMMGKSHETWIAGAMENLSQAPYYMERWPSSKPFGDRVLKDSVRTDGLLDAFIPSTLMGQLAENTALRHGLNRSVMDEYAKVWTQRALTTLPFKEAQTVHVRQSTLARSHHLNPEDWKEEPLGRVRLEKIPTLPAAFRTNGVLTAASSSQLADGATALALRLPFPEEVDNPLKLLPKLKGYCLFSQDSEHFAESPVNAIQELLKFLEWTADDVDVWEINEAFTLVPLLAIKALNLPLESVNMMGGACANGHPLSVTGVRMLLTAGQMMQDHYLKRGVVCVCIGGGEAIAIALEL